MPKTNAISIMNGAGAPATLPELYGLVIEAVRAKSLAMALKSQNYKGDPRTGSVVYRRFANSKSQPYGTARAAGAGNKLNAMDKPVNLDQHEEIVEEVAKFDLDTFGITDLMKRRADDHAESMATTLDTDYFAAIAEDATEFTPTATAINEIVEEAIVTLTNVKNDYVDGVPRALIDVVLNSTQYSKMRTFLDAQANPNVDTAGEEFGMYHGVKFFESTRLPSGVNGLCMVRGAGAQPCVVDEYSEPEKIPLSNDYASSLFYDHGEENLVPDLTFKW